MISTHKLTNMFCAVLLLLAGTSQAGADTLPSAEALVGNWVAEPEFNSQTGSFVLRLITTEEGGLSAEIDLPPIGAWNIGVGEVRLRDESIQIGSTRFYYEESGETLNGILSHAIVPVYDIPVQLRRAEHPPRPVARDDYGVAVDPAWVFATGAPIWSSPTLENEVLYIGSDNGFLYALDARSGHVRWTFRTNGPIRSRPTADDDRLLFQSDDGFLYCLDIESGTEIWKSRLGQGSSPRTRTGTSEARYDHFTASATVVADVVFTGTLAGEVFALDKASGAIKWKFSAGDAIQGTPVMTGDRLVFGSFDNYVYALNSKNGDVLWRKDTGAPVVSTPAVIDDLVIIGSRSYDLFGLDAASGELRWRDYYWFSWVESSANVVDDTVYIGSSDAGYLLALDAYSGRRLWVFDTAGSAWGRPAVSDDMVFIGSVGATGYIVDHRPGFFAVSRATGEARWSYLPDHDPEKSFTGFASSPATDKDRVFVGGLDGRVYAFVK